MSHEIIEKYMKLWGFHSKDFDTSLNELDIKPGILDFLIGYIENFPSSEGQGLVFRGTPRKISKTVGRLIFNLMEKGKINNRVALIDIPSQLIWNKSTSFLDAAEKDNDLRADLIHSDIVVFHELGMSPWTQEQQTKLYAFIYERYHRRLPFFVTNSLPLIQFERHIGKPNLTRLEDSCDFLNLGD